MIAYCCPLFASFTSFLDTLPSYYFYITHPNSLHCCAISSKHYLLDLAYNSILVCLSNISLIAFLKSPSCFSNSSLLSTSNNIILLAIILLQSPAMTSFLLVSSSILSINGVSDQAPTMCSLSTSYSLLLYFHSIISWSNNITYLSSFNILHPSLYTISLV
jgi:hypothetical protein